MARTITIEVEDESDEDSPTTRHLNADAVTYLREDSTTLTRFAKALIVIIPAVTGAVLLSQFVWWQALIGTVVVLIAVVMVLVESGTATIATLTETYDFDWEDKASIVDQFERASLEYVSYDRKRSGLLQDRTTTFLIVPDNVDDILHRRHDSHGLPLVLAGLAVGALYATIRYDLFPTGLVGVAIPLLLIVLGWIGEPDDRLEINFQSGERQTFRVASDVAASLVEEFERHSATSGRRFFTVEPEETDPNPLVKLLRGRSDEEPTTSYHFNVDNVTFVSTFRRGLRPAGVVLVVLGGLAVAGLVSFVARWWQALLAGGLLVGWRLYMQYTEDGITVRTTTDRYRFTGKSVDDLADRFAELAASPIQIKLDGATESLLRWHEYTHTIVPENIITLRRWRTNFQGIPVVVGILALLGGWWLRNRSLPGPSLVRPLAYLLLASAVLWAVVTVLGTLLGEGVRAFFRDGSRTRYVLNSDDAERFIETFGDATGVIEAPVKRGFRRKETQYFNVSGITIFQTRESSRTRLTYFWIVATAVVVGSVILGAVSILQRTSPLRPVPLVLGGGAGLLAGGAMALLLPASDRVSLTTVTGGYHTLAVDNASSFRQAFTDTAEEYLTLEGDVVSPLRRHEYDLHFVPDNVVSLERDEKVPFLSRVLMGLVIAAALPIMLGGMWEALMIPRRHGLPVWGYLFFFGWGWVFVIALSGMVQSLRSSVGELRFEFPTGSRWHTTVSNEDADRIVGKFHSRGPGTAGDRSDPPEDPDAPSLGGLVVACLILVGSAGLVLAFWTTPLVSHLLPLMCDPAVEMRATPVGTPPADAQSTFTEGEIVTAHNTESYVRQAATQGLYRACSTDRLDGLPFESLVRYSRFEIKPNDVFYYRTNGQWYRIDFHSELKDRTS